jgi:hypothetical protein
MGAERGSLGAVIASREELKMTMTRKILIALSLTTFASPAFADTAPRLAIGGVDIVAYLAKGKPVPGTPENQTVWRDARWQFANKEDLDLFVANPEKYAPHYDGHGAY